MRMFLRHSQAADRVVTEVKFDQHCRDITHDPGIMARFDRNHLRSLVFHDAAVCELHMDLPARQESGVAAAEDGYCVAAAPLRP